MTAAELEALFFTPQPHWPPGWPIIRDGIFHGYFGNVILYGSTPRCNEAGVLLSIDSSAAMLDALLPGVRIVMLLVVQPIDWWSQATLSRKTQLIRQYVDDNRARRQIYRSHVAGLSLVTQSALVRTVLRTAVAFAPPEMPFQCHANVLHGARYLSRQLPGLDQSEDDIIAAVEYMNKMLLPRCN